MAREMNSHRNSGCVLTGQSALASVRKRCEHLFKRHAGEGAHSYLHENQDATQNMVQAGRAGPPATARNNELAISSGIGWSFEKESRV
jgi:hypothetical protein